MVSSQLTSLIKDRSFKPVRCQMLLPVNPPDVVSSEQVELDFSDVFGPPPIQASNEVSNGKSGDVNELVYDDPEVIHNRSHSLVGPSACVSQSLKLSGLTIHENEDPLELVDCVMNPPFVGNRDKIQQKIIKDKIKLPSFLTSEAHALLKGLLQKEPSKRLGSGAKGSDEIKGHKWFKSINWKKLEAKDILPSFRPEIAGDHCIANFDKQYTEMPLSDSPVSSPKVDGNHFLGFTYVRPASSFLKRDSPLS
ncbi:hypothetical protein RD792_012141 [Penstemon davidsonii]|uniref:AGC-kinase C-terminal domain-containing protein n=1 Tax=Penstemon davidsonii TaxID=160366 RepID=A0ABR0CXF8_9LAMI|nr:hypothetical protein RD792_012141 [Penstemon davidsonii]